MYIYFSIFISYYNKLEYMIIKESISSVYIGSLY